MRRRSCWIAANAGLRLAMAALNEAERKRALAQDGMQALLNSYGEPIRRCIEACHSTAPPDALIGV